MRKLLSLLVALALVLSVVGTTVFAEDAQLIDTIDLFMPSIPAAGELLCDTESVEVPEGAPYTIEEARWHGWVYGSDMELDVSAPCTPPAYYSLELKLVPAEGYDFAEYCGVFVNGEEKGYYYHGETDEAFYISVDWDVFAESVGDVFLYVDGDEIGTDVDDVEITCINPELISIDEVVFEIYDRATDSYLPYDGIIEEGTLIRAAIRLSCVEEYSFRESSVLINDEYVESSTDYVTVEAYYYIANLEEVNEILVSGATAPAAGAVPAVNGLAVPEDAPYEIVNAYWLNGETYEIQEEAFEDKCAYYLKIELLVDEDYMFTDNSEAFVDGEFAESWRSGNNTLMIEKRFSLKDKITKVDITDLNVPVAGQAPDDEIVVPDVINKDEIYIHWYDWETGESDIAAFAEQGIYEVNIDLMATDGMEFAEDVVVTLNGAQCQYSSNGEYLYIYKPYSIGYDTMDKVEITIEQIEAGQDPADAKVELSEGVELLEEVWAVSKDGTFENAEVFEGKFEDGTTYFYAVAIAAPEGKLFGDDLKVTVNGNEVEAKYVEHYAYTAIIYYGPITTAGEGLTPPAVTPPTGELDLLTPMIALVVLSGAGIVVMMMLKKRRCY